MAITIEVIEETNVSFGGDSTSPIVVLADTDVETIYTGDAGPPGPPGPQGAPGTQGFPGNTILYGAVDPVASDGVDGNFWINTATHFMFGPKASHAWPAGASLIGPAGNTILYGATDPAAGIGVYGNFYINTTSHFMFGPKVISTWPAGTSLVGPQGPQGIQGIQGIQGPPGAAGTGTGNVTGPASSINDDIAVYNGTTGTAIKDGAKKISDLVSKAGDTMTGPLNAPMVAQGDQSDKVISSNFASNSLVRFDLAQAITATAQLVARQNIDAAPFNAIAYFGAQVNGSAQIDQMAFGPVAGGGYFTDQWLSSCASAGAVFNASNIATPFSPVLFPWAFDRCIRLTASTKITAVGAGDYAQLYTYIEGYRCLPFGLGRGASGQPITVAFWAYADVSGTASAAIQNSGATRFCVQNFTLVAGTAKWVVLTFPNCPDGPWLTDNSVGMQLKLLFACGTTYQTGTPGVWVNATAVGTPANTNFFPNNNNSVYISGLMVLPGSQAPTALQSPNTLRPRHDELRICQRYWFSTAIGAFYAWGTLRGGGTAAYLAMDFPVPMRASPTLVMPGNTTLYCGDTAAICASVSMGLPTALNSNHATGTATLNTSAGAVGQACMLYNPTSPMPFDARL